MKLLKQYLGSFALAIALLTVSSLDVKGQQDPLYSQYMFNQLAFNPAYAGSRGSLSGVFLMRRQWLNLDGSPTTGALTLHGPSKDERHGFGFSFIHDRIGITRQNFASVSYAYRLPFAGGNLAFGLRGGVTQYANMFSELNPLEVDPMDPGVNLSVLLPRAGAGLFYSLERFYLGVSVPNLLTPYYQFEDTGVGQFSSRQEQHFFAVTGAVFPLGDNIEFRPSIVGKYVNNAPFQADFNAALFLRKTLWVGVGYRTGDAVLGMMEIVTKKGFRIGYAYDYTISGLSSINSGSHELLLGFDLNGGKKKVISPRYF